MDSGSAKIKLKLRAPNGLISAFGQVKNFIGIYSAQWVEWRINKLLILAELELRSEHWLKASALLHCLDTADKGMY